MDITSVSYLIFVGISLLIYWSLPAKYQWIVLLADSLIFYFVNAVPYTFIYLLISVITVYSATVFFSKNAEAERAKRTVLILTLLVNVGLLVVLKYTNLFISTVNFVGKRSIPTVTWLASLGMSFYTLQIVAYLLNCYWGVTEREGNILKLLLFTSYFPLMISGPISDHKILGHQLYEEHRFDYERVVSGLRRTAWGIAKKVVVADRLMIPVNYMFDDPATYSGIWVVIAAVGFVVVLYFDFSGCMDIIIGVSKCFGIILEENFKAPFLSKTTQEFWQRWHITLGRWLKSFIMYPILKTKAFVSLGSKCKKKFGKQGRKIPTYIAMLAVWFCMGLWHGSSWKYIIGEGLWFWILIVTGQVLEPAFDTVKKRLGIKEDNIIWRSFQVCRTVLLYSFGMVFFHAASLKASLYMLSGIIRPAGIVTPLKQLYAATRGMLGGTGVIAVIVVIGVMQIICDVFTYNDKSAQDVVVKLPAAVRWLSYYALIFAIIFCGNFGKSSFIYFGF